MQTILYRLLAAIGLAAILFGAGWYFGDDYATDSLKAKYEKELKASMEQSRATEQKWQDSFNLNARHLANEINSISSDRDRILKRLHDDKNRASVPQNSGTDCPRPTWRTIPAEMGSEVIREVAERDTYREGLIACYAAIDSLRVAE
jgi:hypothetical protein